MAFAVRYRGVQYHHCRPVPVSRDVALQQRIVRRQRLKGVYVPRLATGARREESKVADMRSDIKDRHSGLDEALEQTDRFRLVCAKGQSLNSRITRSIMVDRQPIDVKWISQLWYSSSEPGLFA
jgi:hypothetical protein